MMIFKGRRYTNGHRHSAMSLGMAYAPGIEGPYTVLNNDRPIFEVDGQGEAEDPFLWKDADGYHAIFKDHVAKFTGKPAYIFFATMDGPGGFENASHSWNMVIPIRNKK